MSQYQLNNAFVDNMDPHQQLVASAMRPSAKQVRFRLVDSEGGEYWFVQKEPAKLEAKTLIDMASALLQQLYIRWRANFDQVEIIIPTHVSERTCDVSGQTNEFIYCDKFVVKSFHQNGYDASAIALRTPSFVGEWRNRNFDADIGLEFMRMLDQDSRILELTFHPEVEDFAHGVVDTNKVMQEVADGLHSSLGLLLRSMEYINPLTGESKFYTPVYNPAE